MRGKFITIEGTEGVGKTTNIQFIESWMKSNNLPYALTRERVVHHWQNRFVSYC